MGESSEQIMIDKLYHIIKIDPCELERIDKVPFIDTPLHTAASCGMILYAKELMILKSSFAWKRNPDGHTPMHLALLNNNHSHGPDMVRALLEFKRDLVRVKGREGETPLHYLAKKKEVDDQKQNLQLLVELLTVCPLSIQDRTNKGKTALHIAVENENFDAFDILLGGLRRSTHEDSEIQEEEIINSKDGEGNTVLHIATTKNRLQVVIILLENSKIEVNAKNLEDRTALDISIEMEHTEVRDILRAAGAKTASSLPKGSRSIDQLWSKVLLTEQIAIYLDRLRNNTKNESRNLILVVAGMVATVAYQAALTPPGGVWQDNVDNTATTSNKVAHRAGRAIMGIKYFSCLYFYNTITLFAATMVMLVLLPKGRIRNLLSGLLFLYLLGYMLSLVVMWP